jgi:hypothetical protein
MNALLATVPITVMAPVIVSQRFRKGACNSSRDAKRLVGDATKDPVGCSAPAVGC